MEASRLQDIYLLKYILMMIMLTEMFLLNHCAIYHKPLQNSHNFSVKLVLSLWF